MGRGLQFFRRVFAGFFFLAILFYTGGFFSTASGINLSILPRVQFVPALLGGSFVIIFSILLFTILFGRWYCSFLCPLGTFQDILGRFKKRRATKIGRAGTVVRYTILFLSTLALLSGTTLILLLFDPWSVFGRLTTTFALPPFTFVNNLIFEALRYFGLYSVAAKEYNLAGISVFLVATTTLLVLCYFIYFQGSRFWCNTVCPVGTLLSLAASKSAARIRISESKCIGCGLCEKECKTGVIAASEMTVNSADCVSCFNCLPVCKDDAISYSFLSGRR